MSQEGSTSENKSREDVEEPVSTAAGGSTPARGGGVIPTGTPAVSSTDPVNDTLLHMTHETFDRLTKYMSGELQASAEDFLLLERLNEIAVDRYKNINNKALAIKHCLNELQEEVKVLEPQLKQIDELYTNVMQLDTVIRALDTYTLDLEKQFRMAYQ